MVINKQSWHYKLIVNIIGFEEPKSLCGYFWKLVGSIAFIILISTIVLCIIPGIFLFVHNLYNDFWKSLSYYGIGFIITQLLFYIIRLSLNYNFPKFILFEYVKAIKDKNCPLIIYKDEN